MLSDAREAKKKKGAHQRCPSASATPLVCFLPSLGLPSVNVLWAIANLFSILPFLPSFLPLPLAALFALVPRCTCVVSCNGWTNTHYHHHETTRGVPPRATSLSLCRQL